MNTTATVSIVVTHTSSDGVNDKRTFKTLKGAQAFAHKAVGADAEVHEETAQAISTDGICRVTWVGATGADLFPSAAQEPSEALAQTDGATFVQTDGPADAIHGEDSAALGHDSQAGTDADEPADVIGEDTAAAVADAAPEAQPATDKPAEAQPAQAAPKAPKVLTTRGASVSATWQNPDVRKARSTHHEVSVAGKGKFKSVPEAFRALGLPMGKMIPFRLLVKETGAATFEKVAKDGSKQSFEFTRVG